MRIVFLLLIVSSQVFAQDKFVKPAQKFLSSLDSKTKEKLMFKYDDNERYNWNFVPLARKGASLHDLNDQQKKDLLDLLQVFLSEQGVL